MTARRHLPRRRLNWRRVLALLTAAVFYGLVLGAFIVAGMRL